MKESKKFQDLRLTGLTITPLGSPARMLKTEGRLGNAQYGDVRTLIDFANLFGRRKDEGTRGREDFQLEVRKQGDNWQVRTKAGVVFHFPESDSADPSPVYTDVTGTSTWNTVSDGDMVYVQVDTDEGGAVTAAAIGVDASLPASVRHAPETEGGSEGATGSYIYKLATVSITGDQLSYRQHQKGPICIEFHRFPIKNLGEHAKVLKGWDATTGEFQARSLEAGARIAITQEDDSIKFDVDPFPDPPGGEGWWGTVVLHHEDIDPPSNSMWLKLTFEAGRLISIGVSYSGDMDYLDIPGTEDLPGAAVFNSFNTTYFP